MNRTIRFSMWLTVSAFTISALLISSPLRAQTSVYYLHSGDEGSLYRVQGGSLLNSWGTAGDQYQYPISVTDTIRTMGADAGDQGAEYDLLGNDLGTRYVHPAAAPTRAWDGATNGSANFSIDTAGIITLFNLDWTDPQVLFDAGGLGGITYDPFNDSLWVSQFSTTIITEYGLDGSVKSSFSTGHTQNMALAMDYADGTLWLHDRTTEGTYEQWTTDGVMLDRVAFAGMEAQNALGGEFQFRVIPEPASGVLTVMTLVGLVARRRRAEM